MYPTLYVTHVINFGPFLKIHGHTSKEVIQQVETVLRHMHNNLVSHPVHPNLHQINPKDVYLIQQNSKAYFRRCKALNVNRTGIVRVSLIDYGQELEISCNQIQTIPPVPEEHFLMTTPAQVSDGILTGVYNQWDSSKLDAIREQLVNASVSYRCEEQIHYLSLISLSWNQGGDVSESLIAQNYALAIKLDDQKNQINQSIEKSTLKVTSLIQRAAKPPLEQPRQLHSTLQNHQSSPPPLGSSRGLVASRPLHTGIANSGKQLIKNHISTNPTLQQRNPIPPNLSYQAKPFEPLNANNLQHPPASQPSASRSHDSYTPALRSNTLMVGSQHSVYVAYIEDGPSLFSVHLKSASDDLDQMMAELGNVPLNHLREKPTIGMACIARYSEDRNLYRAVIMNIKPTTCQVAYVDYGNSEEVKYSDIYEIPTTFLKHPIFAMRFTLSGYQQFLPDTESMKSYFSDLVLENELRMVVNPLDGPPFVQYCDLYLNNENIYLQLVAAKEKRRSYKPAAELQEKELVVIRGIESAQKFFVQQRRNLEAFRQMMDCLGELGPRAQPLKTVEKGSIGICYHSTASAWCRVQVVEVKPSSTTVTVQYVDIGSIDDTIFNNVKQIPDECLALPIQAVECCLEGFETSPKVSQLTVDQIELLADNDSGEPREFNVHINENRFGNAFIVNLIDKATKPILDMAQRVSMMNMPPKAYRQYETQRYQRIMERETNNQDKSSSADRFSVGSKPDNIVNSTTVDEDILAADSTLPNSNNSGMQQRSTMSNWNTTHEGSPINTEANANGSKQQAAANNSTSWREDGTPHVMADSNNHYQTQKEAQSYRTSTSPPSVSGSRPTNKKLSDAPFQRDRPSINNRLMVAAKDTATAKCKDVIAEKESDSSGHFSRSASSNGSDDDFTLASKELAQSAFPLPVDGQPTQVCVSWWISPLKFYVQLAATISEYTSMMEQLQRFYGNRPSLNVPPKIGSLVVCRRPDGLFYRAQILNTRDNLFKYQCVDVGYKTTVELADIYPLEQRFTKLDRIAIKCGLNNVMLNYNAEHIDKLIARYLPPDAPNTATYSAKGSDRTWLVDLRVGLESLRDLLVRDGLIMIAPADTTLPRLVGQEITITVTNSQLPDRFAAHLSGGNPNETFIFSSRNLDAALEGRNISVRVESLDEDNNIFVVTLLKHSVPISNLPILADQIQIEVPYVESTNTFFVHNTKNSSILTQLLEDLYEAYEVQNEGHILSAHPAHAICAAKSKDGNWYRCRIENAPQPSINTVLVRYIDYGNCESVPTNLIRSLSPQFFAPYALAAKVFVAMKPIVPEQTVLNEIEKRTTGFLLDLTVREHFEGNWIVDIGSNGLNLVNVLTELKVAQQMSLDEVRAQIGRNKVEPAVLPPSPAYRAVTPQQSIIAAASFEEQAQEPVQKQQPIQASQPKLKPTTEPSQKKHQKPSEPAQENQLVAPLKQQVESAQPEVAVAPVYENRVVAYMSHADRPDRFYLRLIADKEKLASLTENIQIVAASLPDLEDHTVGTQCIVKYSADDAWYRAVIIDSGLNITSVQFIDYGNTDTITVPGLIKTMNDAFANIKPFAIPCALPLIPKDASDWSDDSCELLRSFCDLEVSFEYLSNGDKCNLVRLWIPHNRDIMAELVHEGHASIVPFINSGQNAFISNINSLNDFYIQMEADTNSLEIMSDYLANIDQFPEITDFHVNKICTAKFVEDDGWYRAKILDHSSDGTEVLFIDYGNTATATELRDLPKNIADMPHLAKQCSLQMPPEIQIWSDAAEEHFVDVSGMGATVFTVQLVQPSSKSSLVRLMLDGRDLSTDLAAMCDRFNPSEMDVSTMMTSSMLGGGAVAGSNSVVAAANPIVVGGVLFKVNTAGDFYVIPDAQKAARTTIAEELQNAPNYPALQVTHVGDLCVARPASENRFYRARVLSINSVDGQYLCSFIDEGFSAQAVDFRVVPPNIRDIPAVLEHCVLQENYPNFNENEKLAEIGTNCFVHIQNCSVEPKVVRLYADVSAKEEITNIVPLQPHNQDLSVVGDSIRNVSILAKMTVGYVSYVNDSEDFWFQVKSPLVDVIFDLMAEAPKFEALNCVEPGNICAAKWDEDDLYYRARVVRMEETGCVVTFIDYGNKTTAVDLRQLPDHLKNMPEMVAHCTLYKSNEKSSATPLTEAQFRDLADVADPLHVQLIDIDAKPNVVRLFRDELLTDEIQVIRNGETLSPVESIPSIHQETEETNPNQLGEKETLPSTQPPADVVSDVLNCVKKLILIEDAPIIEGYLSWTLSSEDMYIQDKSRQEESDARIEALLSAPAYGVLADPAVGDLCAAHFVDDGAFYRARVLEVDNIAKCYTVFFVDYGNTCQSSDLRVLPDNLASSADWAIRCSLVSSTEANAISEEDFVELSANLTESSVFYRIVNASHSPKLIRLYTDSECTTEVLVNRTITPTGNQS